MKIPFYLAMTAEEFLPTARLPAHLAYLGTHFSENGSGLVGLPDKVPEGSILIIDDRTPFQDHDLKMILRQIRETYENNRCTGILLDFQKPYSENLRRVTEAVLHDFPGHTAVTKEYFSDSAILFLPLLPGDDIAASLSPFAGRNIWLDLSPSPISCLIASGCYISENKKSAACPLQDTALNCHYGTALRQDGIQFTLQRTIDDCSSLLEKAAALGVSAGFALYQEIHK